MTARGRLLGLLCAVLVAMVAGMGAAAAADDTKVASKRPDAIIYKASLDDPSNSLTPQQALAGEWTTFQGALARGYRKGTTWVRLRIDPALAGQSSLNTDTRLVLRIQPSHVDQVVVFRTSDLSRSLATVGDTVEPAREPRHWLVHSVVFPEATEVFELLLQVRNKGTHTLEFGVLRWDAALDDDMWVAYRVLAFLAFTFAMILWSVTHWLREQGPLMAVFVATQIVAMVVAATQMGVLRLWAGGWIAPASIDVLLAVAIPIFVLFQVGFHVLLLPDLGARPDDIRRFRWMLLQPSVALMCVATGFRQLGLQLSIATGAIAMPLALIVALRSRHDAPRPSLSSGPLSRVYLIGTYIGLCALTVPHVLLALGLRGSDDPDFYWFLTYSLLGGLLMIGLLRFRAVQVEAQSLGLATALAEANRMEALQRARAREQSDLVTMLVHELKTPLSVVSLSVGRMAPGQGMRELAVQSVAAMREVIERCAEIARFEGDESGEDYRSFIRTVDPIAALRECVSLQEAADRIDIRSPESLPGCSTDDRMLKVILNNLLDNAIKYSPTGSRVTASLETETRDGRLGVVFQVANAVGRAGRPDPNRVFTKYHREDLARHRSGSGLGLYLASRMAGRIGAALKLLPGEEVRFEIWIPCEHST